MRDRSRFIKFAVLIAFVAFGYMGLCAQAKEEQKEEVYRYSKEEETKVINDVTKSYIKINQEKQAKYRKALTEAFARYWDMPEVKATIGPNTITDFRSKADSLSAVLKAKEDPQPQIDSLQVLINQYLALQDSIALQNKLLADKKKEIESVDAEISQKEKELNLAQQQADKFSQKKDSLKVVASNLINVYTEARAKSNFSSVDVEKINNAIEQYTLSRRAIETLGTDDVKKLDETVKSLKNLISLKQLVADALDAMAAKFNGERNTELIKEIRLLSSKQGPTEAQIDFLESLMASLQNEGLAVDNFCSILASLSNKYPCVPDVDSRNELNLDKHIIEQVQMFNSGLDAQARKSLPASGETYDLRYVLLNATLQELLEDLAPNSKMPVVKINTDDKFQSYLRSIANSVK